MNSAPYEFILILGSSSRASEANTAVGLLDSLFVKVLLGTHRTSRTLLGHKGSAPLRSPDIYGHGRCNTQAPQSLRCHSMSFPQVGVRKTQQLNPTNRVKRGSNHTLAIKEQFKQRINNKCHPHSIL